MQFEKAIKLVQQLSIMLFVLVVMLFGSVLVYSFHPEILVDRKVNPMTWKPKTIQKDLPYGDKGKLVKYGHTLATQTSKWIGPLAKDPANQFAGNNLACTSCHLQNGAQAGSASWVGIANRFPQFRGRENKEGTIEERINGCMERSMNGRKLPEDSKEMEGLVAYMEWLSDDVPEERMKEFKGFPSIEIPGVPADPIVGKTVYEEQCTVCHGENGQGVKKEDGSFQYPALWGSDTYNHGAGMHRVLTAAQFIKGNMPYGQATWDNPVLSDEEAYHVAAYINSFDRPKKENTERDFPDRKLKPVSTPYGPWEDSFSEEQHKFGPYPPIIAYYKEKFGIEKKK